MTAPRVAIVEAIGLLALSVLAAAAALYGALTSPVLPRPADDPSGPAVVLTAEPHTGWGPR